MIRTKVWIGLIFVIETSAVWPARAEHTAHRPWLMIGGHHHSKNVIASTSRHAKVARPIDPRSVAESNKSVQAPVSEEPSSKAGDRVAQQALRYKGTRYKFGGTTKKGLDCSGLVSRVFEDLKLNKIPRVSAQLYNAGKPVALSDLRPGDLIFFKNTYRHGISHVGVYAGHNKFVHAANHRNGVIVTPMSDPYYQLHYAGARRLY